MKGRSFNYRPLCVVFASLILGSLFAYWVRNLKILIICTISISVLICLAVAIIKKKWKYFLVPILSFCLGFGLFYVKELAFDKPITNNSPNEIQSRIEQLGKPSDQYLEVSVDTVYFDGKKQDSTMHLYIYDELNLYSNLEVGSVIKFKPNKFYTTNIYYNESINSDAVAENRRYSATVNYQDISMIGHKIKPDEKLRDKIKINLTKGLTNQNTELVYSALFGDKEFLSENIYVGFKASGVAHLLAVSGLHVGILVGILMGILKLLKAKPITKLLVISVILLFYSYMCGFSVSVVRASIMAIILLLAPILFAEYDSLSSISLAGIILFLFNPMVVFDIGFILSFSCVFGIVMFNKPISRTLRKMHFPIWLSNSLSISTATMVTLIMPMAHYFNTLNIISILANIILIPIFSIGFTFAFVLGIMSLIIPFITYPLFIFNPLFETVSIVARLFGGLPISNFETINIPMLSIVLYLILLLSISCLNVSKKRTKVVMSMPILALVIVSMVVM